MARFRCFATSQPRPFLFFSRRAFSFWWWSALVMQGNFALIFPCTSAPFWHAHLFAIHWISRSLLARAPVRSSLNMNTYPPTPKNISHRIYTIHVGHLFWFQNGEFRRKVRDFHACVPSAICAPEYGIHWRQTGVTTENNGALYLVIVNYSKS